MLESVIARLRAGSLERRLCAGEDPVHDPLLAARAAQLCSRRERLRTADAVQHAVEEAVDPPRGRGPRPQVPVDRAEVLGAAPVLMELVERLRDSWPAWPAGVAHVRRFLSDGTSPLYMARVPGELARRARLARAELDRDIRLSP
jgi:hypothetical protein